MFKKLIATAVSLVLCLATLCACRSYDEFYFDELVFLDVWIGHSGELGEDHFVGEQLISSVEEYVDFCIRWDINLAGEYEDERMENLKEPCVDAVIIFSIKNLWWSSAIMSA